MGEDALGMQAPGLHERHQRAPELRDRTDADAERQVLHQRERHREREREVHVHADHRDRARRLRHIAIAIWIDASAPTASITESGPMPPFAAAATSSASVRVHGLGAERLRLLQTLGDAVDREDARGPKRRAHSTASRPTGPSPIDRDRVARPDLGLQRAVVRGRQDVRQQDGLLDAHAFRDLLEARDRRPAPRRPRPGRPAAPTPMPNTRVWRRSQRTTRPVRQESQSPQPMTPLVSTRSPVLKSRTALPTSTTSPTNS